MVAESRMLLIQFSDDGQQGYIDGVEQHYTFAHVRDLMREDWDKDMLPPVGHDFYFCKYENGRPIRIERDQEQLFNVWEYTVVETDYFRLPVSEKANLPFVSIHFAPEDFFG